MSVALVFACPDASATSRESRKRLKTLEQQRSEEHTSELQSQSKLVCRLLLEKKNRPPTCWPPRKRRTPPSRQISKAPPPLHPPTRKAWLLSIATSKVPRSRPSPRGTPRRQRPRSTPRRLRAQRRRPTPWPRGRRNQPTSGPQPTPRQPRTRSPPRQRSRRSRPRRLPVRIIWTLSPPRNPLFPYTTLFR